MTDKDRYSPEVWRAITDAARQGEEYERQRIIDLLDNPNCMPNDHDYAGGCNCDVVALIEKDGKE
jgi:hypothetical protein